MKSSVKMRAVERVLSATNDLTQSEEFAQQSTTSYYELNAAEYASRTLNADLSKLYEPFLSKIPKHSRILDVGCGAGRDLREFSRRGYRPYGIDSSRALATMAHWNSGAPTEQLRVEDAKFSGDFEGVWACASLLHLPKSRLSQALARLWLAMTSPAVMFVSVQEGRGEITSEDGRFFALYSQDDIIQKLISSGFEVNEAWVTTDTLPGRSKIRWINVLATKN